MLIESMDRLHDALSRMITLLENANREMYEDAQSGYHDEHAKLDRLLDQNEKIARGVVALADIVRERVRSDIPVPLPSVQQFASSPRPTIPVPAPMPIPTPRPVPRPMDSLGDDQPFFAQPVAGMRPSGIPGQPIIAPPEAARTTITPPPLPPLPTLPPLLPASSAYLQDPSRRAILQKFSPR